MFGISVYVSDYSKEYLKQCREKGVKYVFTSLHIPEEIDENFEIKARELLTTLKDLEFKIIADISSYTISKLGYDFLEEVNVEYLRIDYGLSEEEIVEVAKKFKVVLNASTVTKEEIEKLTALGFKTNDIIAMHNFYPKAETALGMDQVLEMDEVTKQYGIKSAMFIPGNQKLRAPMYEGLPTIEKHRHQKPYVSFLEVQDLFDYIFIGDNEIDDKELGYILDASNGLISIPSDMIKEIPLTQKEVTIRIDSGVDNLRIIESRSFAQVGEVIPPENCIRRTKGTITMDNEKYLRYSGEICITKHDLDASERVNVIGNITSGYEDIVDYIKGGSKVRFK